MVVYVRITGLVLPDMARKKQDEPKLLFVLFTDHMTACALCCGGGGVGGGGGGKGHHILRLSCSPGSGCGAAPCQPPGIMEPMSRKETSARPQLLKGEVGGLVVGRG